MIKDRARWSQAFEQLEQLMNVAEAVRGEEDGQLGMFQQLRYLQVQYDKIHIL